MGNSVEIIDPVGGNSVEIKPQANSVEIKPRANQVELLELSSNQVEFKPHANSVECSLFDVTTTSYFLSAAQTLEEHKEAE